MNMRGLMPEQQPMAAGKEFAEQRALLGDRAVFWATRYEQVAGELLAVKKERAKLQAECEALQARVAELEGQSAVEAATADPEAPEDAAAA